MSLEALIGDNLEGDTDITAVVGTDPPRIYVAGTVPQEETRPWITYQRIGTDPGNTLAGASALADAIMQINCVADDYDTARDLAELVRLRMRRTAWPGTTSGSVTIEGVRGIDDDDSTEPPQASEEFGVFMARQDFGIIHRVPVPA